jgi:hypothetical protein
MWNWNGVSLTRYLYIKTAGVKCIVASVKKVPRTSLQCWYVIFWSFRTESSTFKCWELSRCQGAWGLLHLLLSIMYSLIKPSLHFHDLFCCFNASQGSFFPRYFNTFFGHIKSHFPALTRSTIYVHRRFLIKTTWIPFYQFISIFVSSEV